MITIFFICLSVYFEHIRDVFKIYYIKSERGESD